MIGTILINAVFSFSRESRLIIRISYPRGKRVVAFSYVYSCKCGASPRGLGLACYRYVHAILHDTPANLLMSRLLVRLFLFLSFSFIDSFDPPRLRVFSQRETRDILTHIYTNTTGTRCILRMPYFVFIFCACEKNSKFGSRIFQSVPHAFETISWKPLRKAMLHETFRCDTTHDSACISTCVHIFMRNLCLSNYTLSSLCTDVQYRLYLQHASLCHVVNKPALNRAILPCLHTLRLALFLAASLLRI